MTDNSSESSVRSSVILGTLLSGAIQAGQVLVSLILVRLLSPEVYGQFGLLSAVIAFVYVLSMQRFMEYSFHQSDDEVDTNAQFSFGLVLHVGLFVAINIVASLLARIETYAAIEIYLRVASVGILINIPRIFHSVLLQREMRWGRTRLLQAFSFLLSSAVALVMAVEGYGLWALVVHSLLVPVPFVIDALPRLSQLRLVSITRDFYPALRFGLVRNASGGVSTGQALLESSALVMIVGFSSFGFFGRAMALAQLLGGSLLQPMTSILYPYFARIEDPENLRRLTGLLFRVTLWIGVPVCVVLSVYSESAVLLAFGENWIEAIPLVAFASALFLTQQLRRALGMVMTSQLSPSMVLKIESVMLAAMAAILIGIAELTVLRYLQLVTAASLVVVTWMIVTLFRHGLLSAGDMGRSLLSLVIGGVIVAAEIWLVHLIDFQFPYGGYLRLILQCGLIPLCFLISVRMVDSSALGQILDQLPGATIWRKMLLM